MHLEIEIKVNSKMHLEAVMKRVWRPSSSDSEMLLEAEIKLN
jgi:hypothetical protein